MATGSRAPPLRGASFAAGSLARWAGSRFGSGSASSGDDASSASTSTAIGGWFWGEAASGWLSGSRRGVASASVVSVLSPFWSLIQTSLPISLATRLFPAAIIAAAPAEETGNWPGVPPQALAMASAMATVRRAMSAWSRSTILPSTCSAPLEAFSGRSKTSMILRAKTTSASEGAKTSLQIAT